MKKLIALLAVLALVVVGLVVFAVPALAADSSSSAPSKESIVIGLVSAWGLIAPLTVYKWIPADDARMKLITVGVSVLIAVLALVFTGQLHLDLSSAAAGFVTFTLVYGESQAVFSLLTVHPRTTSLVA